jgi:mono/diheme cytochrome c family protein
MSNFLKPGTEKDRQVASGSQVKGRSRFPFACRTFCVASLTWVVACFACSVAVLRAAPADKSTSFESQVLPIFESKCVVCHGANSPQQGLDLRSRAAIIRGGKSGPTIQVGSSTKSLLMEKIITKQMPPMEPKLTNEEVETIRAWIDRGAPADATEVATTKLSAVPQFTEEDVLPIFQVRCVACHGKREQKGGLDLRTQSSRLKGGKSGPALVPGKPDESLMIRKIESGDMPPTELQLKYSVRPPTEAELAKLRAWITDGCPPAPEHNVAGSGPVITKEDRNFWSFRPPLHPPTPKVRHQNLVRNAIDAFLLQKLEEKNLSYSPEADPLVLLRRVYLDLTGMPPSPDEVGKYLNDRQPDRYERLVDRLLGSPEYGERWARHWLDLAGHADSEGFGDSDPFRPYAWRYRDYVIRALNSDKPYNQFLSEQIAGDELADYSKAEITPELIDRVAGTGFLRTAADATWEPEFAFLAERMNVLADQIQILTSAVMGLTVACARCHDHKYDPISQRDYYRLSAVLQAAYDPYDWLPPKERKIDIALESEKKETAAFNAPLKKEMERLEQSLEAQAKPFREKLLEERLASLPEGVRQDLRNLINTPQEKRSELQNYLAEKFKTTLEITDAGLMKKYEAFKTIAKPIHEEIEEVEEKLRPEPHVRVLSDMGGEPSTSYLLRRGEILNPGPSVEPGVPEVLTAGLQPYKVVPPWPGTSSSGRRLALARWLTQSRHPLTSRVMVNQIWMRHFGRGLVPTASNFGRSGMPPSHPELLDWLATEFVSRGWSMKHMHRLIMTSSAYRQSSGKKPEILAIDPENALLSRMTMRRLDAEQIYDSILKVTERLDAKRFGPPEEVEVKPTKEIVAKGSQAGFRRGIYILQRRTTPVTLLEVYDLPQMTPNCVERSQSNVATQALQMMNSGQMWELVRYMAGRVMDEVGDNREKQVNQVYLRALSRPPTEFEMRESLATLEELTRHWPPRLERDRAETPKQATANWLALAGLCHTILNSADFMFID